MGRNVYMYAHISHFIYLCKLIDCILRLHFTWSALLLRTLSDAVIDELCIWPGLKQAIPYTLQAVANQGCCETLFCIVFAIIHPLHLKIGKDLRSSWIFLNVLVVNWLKYANSLKLPQSKRLQEYICMLYIVYCSVQSVSPYGKLPQQIGVEQCEIFAWIKLSKLFPSWRPISSSSSPSPSLSLSLSC